MSTFANVEKIRKDGRSVFIILSWLFLTVTAQATLTVYPQLTSIQGCQFSYTLQAKQNGTSTWYTVPLYNAQVTNQNGSSANTTVANFSCSGAIDIKITFSGTVTSAAVRPSSLSITPTLSGSTVSFTIPGPKKFYVDINGDHYNNCIHIMAQPLEVNPPNPGDPNVVFIPTGTFNTSPINLTDGQTLYIQGGAAVSSIGLNNNTKVLGRGFVYRASYDAYATYTLDNVYIDGPIDLNHGWGGNGGCGFRCGQSSNITIRNTASFSSKKWGDGYDIFCSQNVTVDDVFIRTNDDAITFYGGGKSGFTGNCQGITVTNSVLLPDLAQSFHVGVYGDQNIDTEIGDIIVANVDIDDWSRTPGRPVIYFTVGDRVRATDIKFNNVRTTAYMPDSFSKSFIGMAIVYNGTYNYAAGRAIDNVYYTNCSYTRSNGTPGSSINGYDATRTTTGVYFSNLKINGTTITSASAGGFNIGSYASDVTFSALSLIAGSTYALKAKHSGKAADVTGGSTADRAKIIQWTYWGGNNQKWVFEDAGNGFYKFKNVNSGKYMDISDASTTDGANVIQWTSNSGQNQQFLLIPQGGNYYSIMARHSGKCIDVNGASTADGAVLVQWPYSGADDQIWLIQ